MGLREEQSQAEGLDGRPRPLPRLRPCLTSAAWLCRLNTTGALSRQPRAPCRGAGGRPLRRGLRVPARERSAAHAVTRLCSQVFALCRTRTGQSSPAGFVRASLKAVAVGQSAADREPVRKLPPQCSCAGRSTSG